MRANIAALQALRTIQAEARQATPSEHGVLARWSGWGAVPAVLDARSAQYDRYAWARDELAGLLNEAELAAAARNTLNAHYTDAAYVQVMWDTVRDLGFQAGQVLEPGSGSGNFIAFAPDGAQMVGVELEPITAAIAQALHPQAQILHESFADTRAPEGTFDLVMGNVPFAQVALHDKRHNPAGHSIHNHFIVKALHLTKPGGLVAVLSSSYTMDAANPAARREMAQLADLVGAVRLPSGAHRRAAGTDVVTDVLVLRRREDDRESADTAWERSHPIEVDGATIRVNEYFLAHPGHVLGRFGTGGMNAASEMTVVGDRVAAPALRAALHQIVETSQAAGLTQSQQPPDPTARPVALVGRSAAQPDGYLQAEPDGTFTRIEQGSVAVYQPAATQAAELRALIGLRDTEVALLEAEAASIDDTEDIDRLRATLNADYDAYLARYGPINRFTQRPTGRTDSETGEPAMARIRPRQGGFRDDPFASLVYALEDFDSTRQTATKADILGQRVVAPRAPRLGADTPADALAICLDSHGDVRLDEIARLLGVEEDEARAGLGDLVFDEPGTERLVPAPEYLSGHVRVKLDAARTAADTDPRYATNVAALTAVIPPDLAPDEIEAKLGASWIDAATVQQFLRETLDDSTLRVEHAGGAVWAVKSDRRRTVAATSQWGIPSYPAPDIAQAVLEQRQIRLYDETDDGKRFFNPDKTIAAQQKAQELADRFSEWVWQDPQRGATLAALYNEKFNSLVLRSYDQVPLSLPGLSLTFKPFPHQVAAVARVLAEPSVGLFHTVGAGKTAEMAMAAMELRRLGMVNKPAIVVPNHMLEQFGREFLQLYPQAKILAASTDDLARERRRLFVGRCATGEWDAIIITRSAFERIQMSADVQRAYLQGEVDAIETQLEQAKASDQRLMIKRLEGMKLRVEERLKGKLDGAKDPGIIFERTGIDYLFVDEAHGFKNLRTPSNVPNMSVDGSQRASDLHMKIEWLRERYERVATLATGTPIANSMGEAYTMLRYLRPDLLRAVGITSFDSFAATFGTLVTQIEVAPEGGMRMNTRFAKFVNVPELLRMWHVAGDIKMAEDLNLPVPAQAERPGDGERAPETIVVPSSEALQGFIGELADRADRVRNRLVDPDVDNLLKITSEGRAAALDLRLVGRRTNEPSKIDAAADTITGIWRDNRERVYRAPGGEDHPTPGALQIVFADLGTPKPGRWSVYDELREQLAARGMPREQVRFMHEARNDREKGDLFAAARDGRIAVLVGSTERMGVGTNVQARAVALHHLDCPWRPADLEQREGRILRQGNQNPEIRILRYVTEGSFDGYSWQTVTRKAQFIAQVMRGKLDVREIEDIGDTALSYNEVKALATGNPLLLDQAQAQADVARLERLERSYFSGLNSLRYTIREGESSLEYSQQRIANVDAALAQRVDTHGDAFAMTITGQHVDNRPDAGKRLRAVLTAQMAQRSVTGRVVEIGSLGGFTLTARVWRDVKEVPGVGLELVGLPLGMMDLSVNDVDNASIVTRLENRLTNLEQLRRNAELDIDRRETEIGQARDQLDQPFRQADALTEARERLQDIDAQIENGSAPTRRPAAASTDDPARRGGEVTDDNDLSDAEWAARAAAHDAAAMAAQFPGQVTVHTDLDSFFTAVQAAQSAPRKTATGPSEQTREDLADKVQRFYEASWYGTREQEHAAGRPLGEALGQVADQFMVRVEVVAVGDFIRAEGRNPHDGTPDAVTGIVTETRYTERDATAEWSHGFQFGYHLDLMIPPHGGRDGATHELFVDESTFVLRMPGPDDHGRPAWLDPTPPQPIADPASPVANENTAPLPTPPNNQDSTRLPRDSHDEAPAIQGAGNHAHLDRDPSPAAARPTAVHEFDTAASDTSPTQPTTEPDDGPASDRRTDPRPGESGRQQDEPGAAQRAVAGSPELDTDEPDPRTQARRRFSTIPAEHRDDPTVRAAQAQYERAAAAADAALDHAATALRARRDAETVNHAGVVAVQRGEAEMLPEQVTAANQEWLTAKAAYDAAIDRAEQQWRQVEAAVIERGTPPPGLEPAGRDNPPGSDPAAARPATDESSSALAPWTSRIRVVVGRDTVVTGTIGGPQENGLRTLLKQHRFRFTDGQWRYAGRREDRDAAIGDIQQWLATQDRAQATAATAQRQYPPTAQQRRIIDAYLQGRTIAVQALAGTGKTSTLLMLAQAVPQQRIAYIAFNRSIADEAQSKFPRNVTANTSHAFARDGLANTPLRAKTAKAGPKSDGARFPADWAAVLGIRGIRLGDQVVEPDTLARAVMGTVRNFRESADDNIGPQHVPERVVAEMAAVGPAVLSAARKAWQDITDPDGQLIFDHDDYLKIWALGKPRLPYDAIFFDEAQDINDVLRKVIQDQPTQTIVVGDSNQSIYGFRGAIDALRDWPAELTLPLTQSWRFGPAVAEVGNQFLRLLDSPWLLTGNPGMTTTVGLVEQPDAVLARTNAGAVAAVFDAFDSGRRVALVGGGRAIEDIAKAAKELQASRPTKHPELSRFNNWDDVLEHVASDEDAQSLRAFVRLVERRGADGLLYMAKELVNEKATDLSGVSSYDVIVSTVHKAKGREWPSVRIADDFPQPKENTETGDIILPAAEELRLAYVTVTRAQQRVELGSLGWIAETLPTRSDDLQGSADRREQSPSAVAEPAAEQTAHERVEANAPGAAAVQSNAAALVGSGAADALVPAAGNGSVREQRRQVTAWLAEGLIYEGIAETVRNSGIDGFARPDGRPIGAEQIDTHLAELAGATLRGEGPQPGVYCGHVRVSFHALDERSVQMQLTTDGKNHVRIPVPAEWISDDYPGRIRTTMTDAIANAQARAAQLHLSANSLADRINGRPTPTAGAPQPTPIVGPATESGIAVAVRHAFPAPPRIAASSNPHQPPTGAQAAQPSGGLQNPAKHHRTR